jgi:AsmA protein
MRKPLKSALFVVGGLAALAALGAVAALLLFTLNTKPRLEAAASDVLGMAVTIGGDVHVRFVPGLGVTLEDVTIRNLGSEVAAAKEAKLGIALFPLLHKQLRIDSMALTHVKVTVEQGRDGRFSFEAPAGAQRTLPEISWTNVSVSDGTLFFADLRTGRGFQAGPCDLHVDRLQLLAGAPADLLERLSATATVACNEVRTKTLVMHEVKFPIDGKGGVFELKPVTLRLFGGQGAGSIHAEFGRGVRVYRVQYSLSKFQLAEFYAAFSPTSSGQGSMDFSANLTMAGKTIDELTRSTGGHASLRAENLTLRIGDLDQELANYESSQNFNLIDLGAVFFAGPFGLAITKGYNFATIFAGSAGSTHVLRLVSEWHVDRGVAQAQDVAMATKQNRIALKGGLDFVNGRFKDVTVAAVDAHGCPIVLQKIHGSFDKPEIEKPNVLTSLAGPVSRLFMQARKLLGGTCDVFYAGSVAPPH